MEAHKTTCSCGCQEHGTHHAPEAEREACCSVHDHKHSHEHRHDHDACSCGHDHPHHHEDSHGCSCGCGHDHEHGDAIEKEEIVSLTSALLLLLAGLLLPVPDILKFILYVGAYVISGWKVLLHAVRNIARGRVFDETFLMAVASLGACAIGEVSEGAAVMLFYNIGELLQSYAVGRSRKSITELMDIRPDVASIKSGDAIICVPAEEVEIGQSILVRAGEKIPLDGVVLEGTSQLDTAALTGESLPREIQTGDTALAGCINLTGTLVIRVTKTFETSTAARILEAAEHASKNKANTEQFITRFARYYTPVVVVTALTLAVIPPVLHMGSWSDYIYRALNFLVVSCPCALVISVPMGFFAGIGRASKEGILVKGGNYLEALDSAQMVAFDKTGTLTRGELFVIEVRPVDGTAEQLLETAVLAEAYSTHPIALALKKAYGQEIDMSRVGTVTELAGNGVQAEVDGCQILAGNGRLMTANGISIPQIEAVGTLIHIAKNSVYQGYLLIGDRSKDTAKPALKQLKLLGITTTVMLTGDRQIIADAIAQELGLDVVRAELLPTDKLHQIEEMIANLDDSRGKVLFVGDGMNDAPVLARADVGIAMGGIGSDAAIEAADVVIMDDDLLKLPAAISIARMTRRIIIQNIVFAIGVKLFILILSAFGHSSMWAAVFADVGVCILTVLNCMRIMFKGLHK